jgi:hypothetical protein
MRVCSSLLEHIGGEVGGRMYFSTSAPRLTSSGMLKVPFEIWRSFQHARLEISAKAQTIWFSHPMMGSIESSSGIEDDGDKLSMCALFGSNRMRHTKRKFGTSTRVADARTSNQIDILTMNRVAGLHRMRASCGPRYSGCHKTPSA